MKRLAVLALWVSASSASTFALGQSWSRNSNYTAEWMSMVLAGVVVLIVIFLVFREIFCWYWKINKSVALLTEIRDLLKGLPGRLPLSDSSPSATSRKQYPPQSMDLAKKMAAGGYSTEKIAKELRKTWLFDEADADTLARSAKDQQQASAAPSTTPAPPPSAATEPTAVEPAPPKPTTKPKSI